MGSGQKGGKYSKALSNKNSINMTSLKDNIQMYQSGGYDIKGSLSSDEYEYIKDNMKITTQPLYRLEDNDWMAYKLSKGDTFTFDTELKSFSTDMQAVNRNYSIGMDDDLYETPVVFKTVGNTRNFNIEQYSNDVYKFQKETFSGGKFKVIKIGHTTLNKLNIFGQPTGKLKVKLVEIKQI